MNDLQTLPISDTKANNGSAARSVDWNNPRVAAILQAAAKCFARKGFSSTTLAEIGKELGLRKSIVHYYFASKAALIHEVQSFSYQKYLDKVKEALTSATDGSRRAVGALESLWDSLQSNRTLAELNIEVWSAARRDTELKLRAAALQRDAREIVRETVGQSLSPQANGHADGRALSMLIMAVLNGLSVAEYLEGEEVDTKQAYDLFLDLVARGLNGTGVHS
jgi:AcrR family transcriptional regulator